jgi:hypothetical protein
VGRVLSDLCPYLVFFFHRQLLHFDSLIYFFLGLFHVLVVDHCWLIILEIIIQINNRSSKFNFIRLKRFNV